MPVIGSRPQLGSTRHVGPAGRLRWNGRPFKMRFGVTHSPNKRLRRCRLHRCSSLSVILGGSEPSLIKAEAEWESRQVWPLRSRQTLVQDCVSWSVDVHCWEQRLCFFCSKCVASAEWTEDTGLSARISPLTVPLNCAALPLSAFWIKFPHSSILF